ncbi:DUF4926 domain-containing protein [Bacillus sp. BGMRC 2118]|nr:DUF4926 domain-containing protein [Bacillus sp. BGMRC 2118]
MKLKTDKYKDKGAPFGSIDYIIEQYNDIHYDVEFSDPSTGYTYALIVVRAEEMESDE